MEWRVTGIAVDVSVGGFLLSTSNIKRHIGTHLQVTRARTAVAIAIAPFAVLNRNNTCSLAVHAGPPQAIAAHAPVVRPRYFASTAGGPVDYIRKW
ncbi:hypothetical protein EVAR_35643_1 [Eumeta japonica]|uniref:Uncharacterized protein n=1 Tax=Eumeta variegata TaxID=151549 RepID=A0A4C1WD57_EUMVA|nr:hypothetical protein EVAR_35643_1 [Eumeta japonica]